MSLLGLTCVRRGWVCVLAVVGCWWLAAPASAYVYWTNLSGNTIGRAGLDGTGVDSAFISFPPPYVPVYPLGLAVDGQHIYWTNYGNGAVPGTSIGRANLNGTGVDLTFITGANAPGGVAVDGEHLYWTNIYTGNPGRDTIGRANLDGTGVSQNFIPTPAGAGAVAVDGSHVYWTNGADSIGRANLDGSGVTPTFIAGPQMPVSIAVDGQHIYWGNDSTNTVGRANLDGTGVNEGFITAGGAPEGVAVDSHHIYWSNDDSTIGRAHLDGSAVSNTFIGGAGQAFGVAIDQGGGNSCGTPPPGDSPIDCGAGVADTGLVPGVTWGQSCASEVGCFPVSFDYTIRGSVDYETYDVGKAPWRFWYIARINASLVIDHGRDNGWGIEVVPGVAPYLTENWQRLSCVNNGATAGINLGVVPTVGGIFDPASSVIARAGPVKQSLYDPKLTVTALGYAKDYEYETGSNFFFFSTPEVGLISPGCAGMASAASHGFRRFPTPTSAAVSTGHQTSISARGAAHPATPRRVRFPRVTIDGRVLPPAALTRTGKMLAAQNTRLARLTVVREAVALAVLDSLLDRQAIRRRPIARQILNATVDRLVRAYNRDPLAAHKEGLRIPQGESARQYFFSPRSLRGYTALLTLGTVRNAITRGAHTAVRRRQRYARWLQQALRHHDVKLTGMRRFSLPAALPNGIS
jgi:virginiamycin B lyase